MGKKQPKSKRQPAPMKEPRSARFDDVQGMFLRWSLGLVDLSGPFGWQNCTLRDFQNKLAGRLAQFETMKWSEIEGSHNHAISVNSLSKEARKRLVQLSLNDVDEVFSLRIRAKERVFGIRDRDCFRILWWDPSHQVCPSTKRG